MSNEDILVGQREAYRETFLKHGDAPEATFQNNRLTQRLRFETLIKHLSPHFSNGKSVHDIGSGLCDFYAFMQDIGIDDKLTYSGTEIVEEMNVKARAKYPQLDLRNRDFLDPSVDEKYDFLVLSGTLNMLWGTDEAAWKALCFSLIEKMFKSARIGIAFNMLTSYRTFSDPNLCYFDPREVFDFATTRMSRFITLDASYPLYETTFTVMRKEYLASIHDSPDLQKYFR